MFVCIYDVCAYVLVPAMAHMWQSEDNLMSVLVFYLI